MDANQLTEMPKHFVLNRSIQLESGTQSLLISTLRPADLIAKLAGSNLKNTIRVIIAIEVLRDYLGVEREELLDHISERLNCEKPSDDNAIACEAIYRSLLSKCTDRQLLRGVRRIEDFGNARPMMDIKKMGVSDGD